MYHGVFERRTDILTLFGIKSFEGILIFAAYDFDRSSASITVVYLHDGQFNLVDVRANTPEGMKGQWSPQPVSTNYLLAMSDERGLIGAYSDDFRAAILTTERLLLLGTNDETIQSAVANCY